MNTPVVRTDLHDQIRKLRNENRDLRDRLRWLELLVTEKVCRNPLLLLEEAKREIEEQYAIAADERGGFTRIGRRVIG